MKGKKFGNLAQIALMAVFGLCAALSSEAQQRVVLGGKAVVMVADAVYLFPGMDRRVLAVAGADQGLGIFLSALDSGFSAKPLLDRNAGAEAYASFKPDVIMKSSMKKSSGPALDSLGIRQLYLGLETPEDYLADIRTLGAFFSMEKRASQIIEFYGKKMTLVESRVASAGKGAPRVLLVQAGPSGDASWEVPPESWMQTRLVEMSGGKAVWKNANPGSGWARVNAEQVAAWNPEVVLVVDYRRDSGLAAKAFAADPRLAGVSAVVSGKVFGFPQDFYSWDQPDTRWILGLEWTASRLHPEAFSNLSLKDEAREFYSLLYGLDAQAFARLVEPKLSGSIDK
jgi:iron complex transport system substrate-binding protein